MTMPPILLAAAMAFPDGKRCAVTYTFDDGLVFMSHGMKRGYDAWENPEELKKHLEWVKMQSDVWVGTFGEVAAYTLEGNDGLR